MLSPAPGAGGTLGVTRLEAPGGTTRQFTKIKVQEGELLDKTDGEPASAVKLSTLFVFVGVNIFS